MPYTSADSPQPSNQTYRYVSAFIDELQRAGLHHVVICPGSRSTPLALAIAQHPALRIWMHVDERSAAFFGLGMAKYLAQPVALVCTSGTAAANFMPAIVEAKLSHVPLLVLTADRPHELRDCGAPQAIDQNKLYGSHVKWFTEVALPQATNEALRYIRTLANRTVALTQTVPAGPVHLNFPFREPLTPEPHSKQSEFTQQWHDRIAWQGRLNNEPYIRIGEAPQDFAPRSAMEYLISIVNDTPKGLIIVGPLDNARLIEPLIQLAQRLGYPILADPLSQLRCGPHDHRHIMTGYDALLHSSASSTQMSPHIILRFGAMPTSKALLLYLKQHPCCPQVVIDGHGSWEEPTQLADMLVHVDPVAFCHDFLRMVASPIEHVSTRQDASSSSWLSTWQEHDELVRKILHVKLQEFEPLFEGRVFTELAALLPNGTHLFIGNSMPVRDLDSFFWGSQHRIRILGNRGANGIDGIVSTALGVSAASSQDEPTVLVIGDLSFFHDMNGLLAAHLHHLNLTIVLVNNDGGGIFSFLPQAAYPEHFEQLFGTPIGLDFRPAVQMYGGQFERIATWQEFREALRYSCTTGGLHVIEVPTERESNVQMHHQLWLAVEQVVTSP